jgi:hypothetical protein
MSKRQREYLTANTVIGLLAAKHASDLFVGECKDGPTWGGAPARLDGWAMRRSWAHPCTTGYEVKVSRSDWLRDKKWPGYVDLVHEFYLVAPDESVIGIDEVPDGIGLLYVSSTNTRLFTKRKAVYRQPSAEAANTLMTYVLMSRASIDAPRHPDPRVHWREWLAKREEDRKLGWEVSKKLRAAFEREVDAVRRQQVKAEEDREFADRVIKATEVLGVQWSDGWKSQHAAEKIACGVAAELHLHPIQPHERHALAAALPVIARLTDIGRTA